jgi:hypothetical protein
MDRRADQRRTSKRRAIEVIKPSSNEEIMFRDANNDDCGNSEPEILINSA